jgi:hypothetical protein
MHSRVESDRKYADLAKLKRTLAACDRAAARHHPDCRERTTLPMYLAASAVIDETLAERRRTNLMPVEDA